MSMDISKSIDAGTEQINNILSIMLDVGKKGMVMVDNDGQPHTLSLGVDRLGVDRRAEIEANQRALQEFANRGFLPAERYIDSKFAELVQEYEKTAERPRNKMESAPAWRQAQPAAEALKNAASSFEKVYTTWERYEKQCNIGKNNSIATLVKEMHSQARQDEISAKSFLKNKPQP